jgi:hypothetical protein
VQRQKNGAMEPFRDRAQVAASEQRLAIKHLINMIFPFWISAWPASTAARLTIWPISLACPVSDRIWD